MDSGNSGSLQSSSGGEDEFDSRSAGGGGGGGGVDSSPLSALLRPSPSPSSAAFSLHGSYFGLQDFTSAPPQQQQAGAWSGSFAGGASGLSSSSSPRVVYTDAGARPQGADTAATTQGQGAPGMGAPAPAPSQQPPRGSRKRTRASRRAPTTVLTTDTSNFRAMVQEFTGIPSPPFGAGVGIGVGGPSASLRTRFDHIFPPPSSLRSGAGAAADAATALPPYLLRPFPHKLPTTFPPFTSSASSSSTPSSSNIGVANANAATGTTAATASASSNPVAPATAADTLQQLTSSALLRLQDPSSYLSFQNLLDSQAGSSQSIFSAAAGGFGQQASRLHDSSPSDFLAGGIGSSSLGHAHHGGLLGFEGGMHLHHSRSDVHHGHGGDELSGVVAAGAAGGSCKLNYSHAGAAATSSSAAASADKQPDGGRPGRGDGGLDPWICTSE